MAEYKRQHYVPRFYLSNFSPDGGRRIALVVVDLVTQLGETFLQAYVAHADTNLTQEDLKDVKLRMHMPILMSIKQCAQILPLILDLKAKLLINQLPEAFITSDNPVVLTNTY